MSCPVAQRRQIDVNEGDFWVSQAGCAYRPLPRLVEVMDS